MQQGQGSGTYLYAVVSGLTTPDALADLEGVLDSPVYTIASGDVLAVVSDVGTTEKLRPERRNLGAHQQVLRQAAQASPRVLPVAFGTIAGGPDDVKELLDRYHDDLVRQLESVEGKQQMGIRLVYGKTGTIFDYVVAQSPELREVRDAILGQGAEPTRDQKIDLGQRFESALTALRDETGEKLEALLRERCASLKRNPPRTEQEVARVACLVPTQEVAEWEKQIADAAREFPEDFAFEVSGPFPPYDFVDLHLQA